jgi:hypothetical protein
MEEAMSMAETAVLVVIVAAFVIFGATLAWLSRS